MGEWEDASYVAASRIRMDMLAKLNTPKIPSVLASNMKMSRSHISRALKQLESRDLIICKTPNAKRAKVYGITHNGRQALESAEKLRS